MKFGIALGMLHPALFADVAMAAEREGFDSVWLPEHLVFPIDMSGSPFPGDDHPPVPPSTPAFDVFAYLSYLAGITSRVRLGTNVYLLGLRHPFVAARAVQTLDIVSGGRAEVGVGAGWLRTEWSAAGLDPRTRGRRLDEALAVCKRLWTEDQIEHDGEFYRFPAVMFEPKPLQKPHPPIHVGGESEAALQRAARHGNGWFGLAHTLESVVAPVARLAELRREQGLQGEPFDVIVSGPVEGPDDVKRWQDAGVTHLVGAPWRRNREAVDGVARWAEKLGPSLGTR